MKTACAYTLPSHQTSPALDTGRVTSVQNGIFLILARDSYWQARTAASCLLRPEEGDEVLFTPLPDGRAFVLAVLTRSEREAVLDFPTGASLTSPMPLNLDSATAVQISAPEAGVNTASLSVQAAEAKAAMGSVTLVARILRTCGERLEQTFGRLLGRYGSAQRMVQEDDETQARNVRVSAQETSLTQAGNVTQLARDMARIDAPQVHIS
ncbi:MAG: DUF3540 domain-containing protein [Desulfovibrionaceae bacterium]|nr:DUF3540 domain-containing protein [Desulfovibrionaceae bacterium]